MIGPRKKISIRKSSIRHSQWERLTLKKLTNVTNLVKCKECGKFKLSHRVCPHCGFYAGKQILVIKQRGKQTVIES
ncbi:MAG: 50S ribosomal protein L32 [Candidatus Absconditabacteria bacterium]